MRAIEDSDKKLEALESVDFTNGEWKFNKMEMSEELSCRLVSNEEGKVVTSLLRNLAQNKDSIGFMSSVLRLHSMTHRPEYMLLEEEVSLLFKMIETQRTNNDVCKYLSDRFIDVIQSMKIENDIFSNTFLVKMKRISDTQRREVCEALNSRLFSFLN